MSGVNNGLAAKVEKELESRAVFIHCYGHCVNLAVKDLFKDMKNPRKSSILGNAMDNVYTVTKLIKFSPSKWCFLKNTYKIVMKK